ncbi:MAG TPA: Spy/CpxP family protein refolding chaperone [Terriglobales bacterium]
MTSIKRTLTAVVSGLALCASMAMAQDQTSPPVKPAHHMHRIYMRGGGFGLPLRQLNLTDDQKAQVKQIFQSSRANFKPLMQQEMTARQQLAELVTSGNFDQAKAAAIAAQESQTHAQIEVEHAKIASQIYQLLSSDQKSKVSEIMTQRQQRMQQRMQKQGETTAPAQ